MINLLYIEDDLTSQKIMKHKLKQFHINCNVAGTEKEGLLLLQNHKYDVVLLDYYLKHTTGDKVLSKIRLNQPSSEIYSILITSDGTIGHKMEDTFDRVFIKPIFGSSFFLFLKDLKTIIKNQNKIKTKF